LVWRGLEGNVGPSVVGWIGSLATAALLILAGGMVVLALLAAQWVLLLGLLRQNGRLLARLEAVEERLAASALAPSANGAPSTAGLPVGVPAPAFSLEDLHGEEIALDHLRARGKPVLLVFTDSGCGPCAELHPELGRWQQEYAEKLTISIVGRGSAEENSAEVSEHGIENVLLQDDWEVADAYQVEATPGAVVVSPEGTIASPVAQGPEEVESLVALAVEPGAQLPLLFAAAQEEDELEAPKVGEPAPELRLPDLAGNDVSLDDFRGEETLVLFWSPECGFCQEMLPDLKRLESNPPEGAPRLLVVSDGTVEDNEAMGFNSTVVLDHDYAISDAFGVDGTPSAVLVDAEGRVASGRVDGALAVLGLIRSGRPAV
jgi:thiol-disulfide isomerase/thioredoxin